MDKIDRLVELKNEYIFLSNIKEEVWKYHPSNEKFINPIKEFEDLTDKLDGLEFKINLLEREINSLN